MGYNANTVAEAEASVRAYPGVKALTASVMSQRATLRVRTDNVGLLDRRNATHTRIPESVRCATHLRT